MTTLPEDSRLMPEKEPEKNLKIQLYSGLDPSPRSASFRLTCAPFRPSAAFQSVGYYAIVTPAFVGHVNPMSVLARALQKRGHRATFIAPIDVKSKADRAGIGFIPICAEEFPIGAWDIW